MADGGLNIKVEVFGLEEVTEFMERFPKELEVKTAIEISRYVYDLLLPRIRKRLLHATESHTYSPYRKGITSGTVSGGYGLPSNAPKYKEWKELVNNLPLTGGVSPREMVATGFFLEKIKLYKLSGFIGELLEWHVGASPGERPSVIPMSDDAAGGAKFKFIDNQKVAELLEDSDYAFWAKEFEDVQKDITPLILNIIMAAINETILKIGPKPPVK